MPMYEDRSRDLLIALSLLPFLTPVRTRLLRDHFVPVQTICDAPSLAIAELLRLTLPQIEQVKNPLTPETLPLVESLREHVVTIDDTNYPLQLKQIADPPLVLHVRGDVDSLSLPIVAVVGSRRASPYAVNAAQHLAGQLASAGLVVVSGLARGVDAAAHQSCLDAGGRTIAVMGTGIDLIYPRTHARLAKRIESSGALISEFPPGSAPLAENFPMRNRVISGLSLGVVIVEAGARSGSLITARMAAEQDREVFAVPGSIFSPGSEGTHRLIQSGAKLVHDVRDILEELRPGLPFALEATQAPPGEAGAVLSILSMDDSTAIDDLALALTTTPAALAEQLLELELAGWVRALPGGRYVRAR